MASIVHPDVPLPLADLSFALEWTKAGTSQGPGLRGYYQCRICATATWLPASERRRHTNSAGHLAARADIRPREGQPRAANTNSSFLSRFRSAVTHSSVRLSTPVGPAASTPQLPPQPPPHPPHVPPHAVNMDYDYVDNFDEEQVGASIDDAVINQMKAIFQRVVAGDIVLEDTDNESNEPEPSDNDDDEGPGDDSSNIESAGAGESWSGFRFASM